MEFNSNEELEWWIYTNHLVPSDIAETNAKCQSEKYRNPKHTPSNDFKDDTRNFKGYLFEMRCKAELGNIPNVVYHGNPTAYSDWLHHHNENSFDATITYPNGETEKLEMKYVSDGVKIFPSWFERDWLTRDAPIIVTNNPTAISYQCKRKAEKMGKKILSESENKVRIGKKIHNILHDKYLLYPNKYLYLNSLIGNIISNIQARTKIITSKIGILGLKLRLRDCLFKVKSSLKARFSALIHSKLSFTKHSVSGDLF
jgi:hypothetical protein